MDNPYTVFYLEETQQYFLYTWIADCSRNVTQKSDSTFGFLSSVFLRKLILNQNYFFMPLGFRVFNRKSRHVYISRSGKLQTEQTKKQSAS